ncbi:MAG: hypothetical protein QOF45_834 [Gaiellaceae bacterium]|jgi:uncharacterized protein (DUF58 family)|nr:hypothetical protein [Gaiellaceae bacterium]
MDTIDWNASARLSSALGRDEFVVRAHFADEAPRVVIVCDRRPEMALYPPPFPWLSKERAMRAAAMLIRESAASVHALLGYLDFVAEEAYWCRPESERRVVAAIDERLEDDRYTATQDTLERALDQLGAHRLALPPGTFVFVLSDFLAPPPPDAWLAALAYRWDIVPVVIQDPVWEQSFPAVGGIALPFTHPGTGRVHEVHLTEAEADARRREHEDRLRRGLDDFAELGVEPILLSSAAPDDILVRFIGWADERVYAAGAA